MTARATCQVAGVGVGWVCVLVVVFWVLLVALLFRNLARNSLFTSAR